MLPNGLFRLPIDNEASFHRSPECQLAKVLAVLELGGDIGAFVAGAARDAIGNHSAGVISRVFRANRNKAGLERVATIVEDKRSPLCGRGGLFRAFRWHWVCDGRALSKSPQRDLSRIMSSLASVFLQASDEMAVHHEAPLYLIPATSLVVRKNPRRVFSTGLRSLRCPEMPGEWQWDTFDTYRLRQDTLEAFLEKKYGNYEFFIQVSTVVIISERYHSYIEQVRNGVYRFWIKGKLSEVRGAYSPRDSGQILTRLQDDRRELMEKRYGWD